MTPAGAPERDAPREAAPSTSMAPPAPSFAGAPPAPEPAAPEREPREASQVREYPAEPREAGTPHEPAPVAHFEPAPKPDGNERNKPYVVWSSSPTEKSDRGPEE
jgi:hypothetical protein